MNLGASDDLEIEIAASKVNNIVVASLGASIAVSVATTVGASVVASSSAAVATSAAAGAAGAATGGAGGGAAGAAGGGGGGGFGGAGGIVDVTTVLMAVQRLSVLTSMPVGMSEMHARVGRSLAWVTGSLGLFPQIVSDIEAREYWGWEDKPCGGCGVGAARGEVEAREVRGNTSTNKNAEAAVEENEQLLCHNALKGLVDTLTTFSCALAAVIFTPPLALSVPNRIPIYQPIWSSFHTLNLPISSLQATRSPRPPLYF